MSTKNAVMPAWPGAVRVSRTHRDAYCARLVQTFWPLITQLSPRCSARVVRDARSLPEPGSGEALAPLFGAVEQPRHHVGREFGAGVGDHRRCEHLDHRVDAGFGEEAGGHLLAEDRPQHGRTAEAPTSAGQPCSIQPASKRALRTRESWATWASKEWSAPGLRSGVEPGDEFGAELVGLDHGAAVRSTTWGRPELCSPLRRMNVIERVARRQPSAVRR